MTGLMGADVDGVCLNSRVLIIDNYDSFTYNLYQVVASFHCDVKVMRNDKLTVDDIIVMAVDAIIISPGPGRPEQAGICVELVQRLGGKIPMLGICLGHQAIAVAYGGKVLLADQPVHGKSTAIFHCGRGIYANMPSPFVAARYHSLVVDADSLPDSLVIESKNTEQVVMGIRHQQYPIYGIQFHPESILTPQGDSLIGNFLRLTSGS